jgi:hypothetical protein
MECITKENTMNIKMLKVALAGLILSVSGFANASLIEYIYTGTGSGSIGNTNFTDVFFTITEYSDTENIQSCGGSCIYLNSNSATISLDGIDLFQFTTGTYTFNNNGRLGFSRSSGDLYNIFDVGNFDMISALAPIAGNPSLIQWNLSPVNTSGGVLSFISASTPGTFEARLTSVPEPSSLAIFALGVMGLVSRRFKKQS